jgi:hypothetical protein
MFGSKKFLHDGAQVDGVLIQSDDGKVLVNAASSYHVRVRVTFDDGTLAEFDSKLNTKSAGMRAVGAIVPVRFDPSDRSKIDIDDDELRRRKDLSESQREAAFAATPAALPSDPSEALQSVWEQLKALDARGSELRRSGAPRDQVGAWVAEKEALDSRFRAMKSQHPTWTPTPTGTSPDS